MDNVEKIFELKNVLLTNHCCKIKTEKPNIPSIFYKGVNQKNFYNLMKKYDTEYGTLSDLYGIKMYNEIVDPYDVHPSELKKEDFKKLGDIIKEKCKNYDTIVFYAVGPLMNIPYFKMLYYSGINCYYITKISMLEIYLNKNKQMVLEKWI